MTKPSFPFSEEKIRALKVGKEFNAKLIDAARFRRQNSW
jgi:hypothetical protein